ncbi:MAG: hypothetical protein J6D03_07950 [Clostridia bacterium]|nr:hypothetical protein [Clostridia bacterium]
MVPNIILIFFHFNHSNSNSKNPIKKTEYFNRFEILCNIDDYCILLNFYSGWYIFNTTGVDLNLQFPARWEEAREIKYSEGFTTPAPRDYVGLAPLTQPEPIALYNFTNVNNFRLTISYHTQGKEIYWRFLDFLPEDSLEIAREFSKVSGYTLSETPYRSSFAGYRDWFIQDFNRPGFTIEAGEGVSPLPISQFDTIYADNEGILVLGMVL